MLSHSKVYQMQTSSRRIPKYCLLRYKITNYTHNTSIITKFIFVGWEINILEIILNLSYKFKGSLLEFYLNLFQYISIIYRYLCGSTTSHKLLSYNLIPVSLCSCLGSWRIFSLCMVFWVFSAVHRVPTSKGDDLSAYKYKIE